MSAWRGLHLSFLSIAAAMLLVACGPKPGASAPAAAPPPEVGVVVATKGSVGLVTELPGRTEASRIAQVRARVAGVVQRRLFNEGSDVKAGQPLFRIDDAPYRATLASAQAALARAEANLMQTRTQAERYKPLAEANAVSQQEYIAAQAAFKQSEADVASAKAALQTAQINLGYAAVNAPISGRIGRALVTEGALVGQGEATQLAVVQQIDPLYVNFTQSAAEVLRLRAAIASGRYQAANGAVPVTVTLDDGGLPPQRGRLLFSDLTVDPSSDQITLRAELPNPKGALLPGLYVRVRLEQAQVSSAILLPQQAVQRGSAGDTVMVVDAEGKVATRPVRVSMGQNRQWVVLDGLAGGEQVVVDGFQKVRPNAAVKPVPWQAAASVPAATAPASAASR
ncbi:efflux RND transporter periplasmic adaptor subunit [Variovorax sp. YR752]|uniref:efflux RND transporter periplasmic adaptor subunit n=1 Tax=Variovorax sp. YR752 TaxID=1884383 RepID=UPI003137E364